MPNQMLVIAPYWLESAATWVFDDDAVDLVQEPFVSGVPEMIDNLMADIPNAKMGFRLGTVRKHNCRHGSASVRNEDTLPFVLLVELLRYRDSVEHRGCRRGELGDREFESRSDGG